MTNWIKCTDRLPEIHSEILTISEGGGFSVAIFDKNDEKTIWLVSPIVCAEDGRFYNLTNVTHWQLLPEPPKED